MKILFVVGDGRYILTHRLSLMTFLKKHGHQVFIACPPGASLPSELNVYPLSFTRGGLNPLALMKGVKELRQLIDVLKPDIVHAIAMKPTLMGLLAVSLKRKDRPRFVATLGGLGYLFISSHRGIRGLRYGLIKLFNRLFQRTQGHLILQNDDDARVLQTLGLKLPHKVCMIRGSGVSPQVYAPTPEPKVPLTGPRVVYVGRLLKDKGLREFMEAIDHLQRLGLQATYHLYGEIDSENPASLTVQDIQKWQHLAQWHGHTADPAKVYQQAHIAVLPSYREGLPKSLLEAGMVGRAMIATNVPGCNDVVLHEQTGLLVPPYEAQPLAQAIERLVHDPSLRQQLGLQAHQHVKKHFSDEVIQRQHQELYEHLLSSDPV